MEYKPKRNNKKAVAAVVICTLGAIACIIFGVAGLGFRAVNQLLVLCFLTAALFFLVRYVLTDFVYTVSDDGYLEVKKISSRIPITMASVRISAEDIIVKDQKDMSAYQIKKKERFNLSIGAEELYWYIFTVNGEKQALGLECESSFAEYLQSLINSKKEAENNRRGDNIRR